MSARTVGYLLRMKLLSLSAADLRAALPMRDAVEAMKVAFAALSTGRASAPPRTAVRVDAADGVMLLMGAHVPDAGLCAKVVSIFRRNEDRGRRVVNGLVLVLDETTGEVQALCDGTFLTAWRTGAASGAATDLLARADARIGAVIGCGAQARTQVLGIDATRGLEVVRVFGRRRDRAEQMVSELEGEVSARLEVVPTARAAVEGADVVCTATTSAEPVLDGAWLSPGAHVNGVGAFTAAMRELDAATVGRARVFVDSIASAREEAGDLVAVEREGLTRHRDWTELGNVVAGRAAGRGAPEEITLFKSVGQAVQDVTAAARAVAVARQRGLGRAVEL